MLDEVLSLSPARTSRAQDELVFSLALECALSEALVAFGVAVGFSNPEIVCSFPNTFSSALPSFSIAFVQAVMRAGVAAISAISRISPLNQLA
jgi:hypothetical protein